MNVQRYWNSKAHFIDFKHNIYTVYLSKSNRTDIIFKEEFCLTGVTETLVLLQLI